MQIEFLILKILTSTFSLQFKSNIGDYNETLIQKELNVNKSFIREFHKKNYVSANIPEVKRITMNGLLIVLIYYLRKLNLKITDNFPGEDISIDMQALTNYYELVEKFEYSTILA